MHVFWRSDAPFLAYPLTATISEIFILCCLSFSATMLIISWMMMHTRESLRRLSWAKTVPSYYRDITFYSQPILAVAGSAQPTSQIKATFVVADRFAPMACYSRGRLPGHAQLSPREFVMRLSGLTRTRASKSLQS